MNLQQLIAVGAIVPQEFVKKTITWVHGDEQRNKVEHTFDISIKRNMSAADFEFIFTNRVDENVLMARRVSALVRLGENGDETIDYQTASRMNPSLLIVFCKALNEVEEENKLLEAKKENADEKN